MGDRFSEKVVADALNSGVGESHVFLVEVDVNVIVFSISAAQPRSDAGDLTQIATCRF